MLALVAVLGLLPSAASAAAGPVVTGPVTTGPYTEGGVIDVTISYYDIIVINPYGMAVEYEKDGEIRHESLITNACTIKNNSTQDVEVSATPSAHVTVGENGKKTLELTNYSARKQQGRYLFLLLQLNDKNENWIVPDTITSSFTDRPTAVLIKDDDFGSSGTASITVGASKEAFFRVVGDCSLPSDSNPWVQDPFVQGDASDGVVISVVFEFKAKASYRVKFVFVNEDWDEVVPSGPVGVFIGSENVYGKENVQPMGEDMLFKVVSDLTNAESRDFIYQILVFTGEGVDILTADYKELFYDTMSSQYGYDKDYVRITDGEFTLPAYYTKIVDDLVTIVIVVKLDRTLIGGGSADGNSWWGPAP